MRVDTSLLQGITAANQTTRVASATLKSTGTTTSFSSQLKAATEKETTKPVAGANYAEILTGPRAGLYVNTSGGPRDGEAFVLVKHDGREDHIYGTGDDRTVIKVGKDASEGTGGPTSTETTATDTTPTKTSTSSGGATTTDKTPTGEKTKPVDGHAYADITSGPRKDLYLNTSGNARDGKTFVLVKKDEREYHIYGTGKNREVFSVKDPAPASKTPTSAPTTTSAPTDGTKTDSTTTDTSADGSKTTGPLVTSNPTSS